MAGSRKGSPTRRIIESVRSSPRPLVQRGYRNGRFVARRVVNAVTRRELGWVAMLRSARWIDDDTFEITGWAYERGLGHPGKPPKIAVWLAAGRARLAATVEQRDEAEANAHARSIEFDYANTGFAARFDIAALRRSAVDGNRQNWRAVIAVTGRQRTSKGGFRSRYRLGSAGHLVARTVAGVQVVPAWGPHGLTIRIGRPVVIAREVSIDGRGLTVLLEHTGAAMLTTAVLTTNGDPGEVRLRLARDLDSGRYRVSGVVPDVYPVPVDHTAPSAIRRLRVRDAKGRVHPVCSDLDGRLGPAAAEATLLATSQDGELALLDAPAQLVVDSFAFTEGPELGVRLAGRVFGAPGKLRLIFSGQRQRLPGRLQMTSAGTFEAFAPLRVSVWHQAALPPRRGNYHLQVRRGNLRLPVRLDRSLTTGLPLDLTGPGFRISMQSGPAQRPQFRISPPRRPEEIGRINRKRLAQEYRTKAWTPRNAVYFESFYGRASTCNPRALDREIAIRYPQLTRLWGVVDASIPVPEGAIQVIEGTREWWEARATSRYVIVNDWLRALFTPQPFQIVLQTWHGSMFKRIGLDRSTLTPTQKKALLSERSKWDVLMSQNRHSTDILRSAYDWQGVIIEEGYPRDDPLSTGSPDRARTLLGIRPDQTAILYAPTWRDNQTSMVTFLDLDAMTAALGERYVILLRGHSRTMAFGASVDVPGVIDVTTYPDITQLFLAADALITDYSSVMFDYSVTGRPMIYFVPDLEEYRDELRGVYFDLSELAPGPVLATQDEVVGAIRELADLPERYGERYRKWRELFNHHDDGQAAERVVRQLMRLRKSELTAAREALSQPGNTADARTRL